MLAMTMVLVKKTVTFLSNHSFWHKPRLPASTPSA